MKYKTEELPEVFGFSTCRDKLGNIYHGVDYFNYNGTPDYVLFCSLVY